MWNVAPYNVSSGAPTERLFCDGDVTPSLFRHLYRVKESWSRFPANSCKEIRYTPRNKKVTLHPGGKSLRYRYSIMMFYKTVKARAFKLCCLYKLPHVHTKQPTWSTQFSTRLADTMFSFFCSQILIKLKFEHLCDHIPPSCTAGRP